MKITVIKKATSKRPQNYCPWVVEDGAPQDKK